MPTSIRTETLRYDEVEVGADLPTFVLPVTTTLIVAGAIASRDYMPVHHDRTFAQSQGSKDVFMNILTDNGLSIRYLTDWAGPEAMVKKLSIRLGVSSYPGSTLIFTGSVTNKFEEGEAGLVEVSFQAMNDLGAHISGTAVLDLPRS